MPPRLARSNTRSIRPVQSNRWRTSSSSRRLSNLSTGSPDEIRSGSLYQPRKWNTSFDKEEDGSLTAKKRTSPFLLKAAIKGGTTLRCRLFSAPKTKSSTKRYPARKVVLKAAVQMTYEGLACRESRSTPSVRAMRKQRF
jgi:hypothetical protein